MSQPKILPSQLGINTGFKNWIINGLMGIWQRQTTHTLSTGGGRQYTADRWAFLPSQHTSVTGTVTREAFTLGQTEVPFDPQFFLRMAVSAISGGISQWGVGQPIEGVRTFAGRIVTVSFYAKTNGTPYSDASCRLSLVFDQGIGDANTFIDESLNITNSWQRFEFTAIVPSLAGETINTNDGDYTQFDIVFPQNTARSIDLALVQVEIGPEATSFEKRNFGDELNLCKRYYEKSYSITQFPGSLTTDGAVRNADESVNNSFHAYGPFMVEKRVMPTLNIYSPNTGAIGNIHQIHGSSPSTDHAISGANPGRCSVGTIVTVAGIGIDAGNLFEFHWTADAEI